MYFYGCNLKQQIMYSNEDLERFYFQYKTEAVPSGESVPSFCKRNNVPYNIFSKWYKDTRQKIVEVSVEESDWYNEKDGSDRTAGTLSVGSVATPASTPFSASGKKECETIT